MFNYLYLPFLFHFSSVCIALSALTLLLEKRQGIRQEKELLFQKRLGWWLREVSGM